MSPQYSVVASYRSITQLPETVIADLVDSAQTAYTRVAMQTGIPAAKVHLENRCVDIIEWMEATLCGKEKGYRAARVEARFNWTDHMFLSVITPDGLHVIADPMYQQFLDRELRKLELPTMLLGTSHEVAQQALSYGFEEHQVVIWRVGLRKPATLG